MSQMSAGTPRAASPRNNVYTVLTLVSLLVLLAGAIYVGYKNLQLTGDAGGNNPFHVMPAPGTGSGR